MCFAKSPWQRRQGRHTPPQMTCPAALHATTAGTAVGWGHAKAARAEMRRQPTGRTALVSGLLGMLTQKSTIHVERESR